jgi:transposase
VRGAHHRLRIVRRSSGSVVTRRRARMVLLSAQGMDVGQIARVTSASPDRVRDVLHNLNLDGFDSRYPRHRGGRPPTFTLAQRRAIEQLALSRPQDHELPFSTWSLAKLAEFLVAEGVVDAHLPRGPTGPAPRAGRVLSTPEDLKQARPRLRGHVVKVFQRHRLCVVETVVVPCPTGCPRTSFTQE